jgi:hypothetical protein
VRRIPPGNCYYVANRFLPQLALQTTDSKRPIDHHQLPPPVIAALSLIGLKLNRTAKGDDDDTQKDDGARDDEEEDEDKDGDDRDNE